MSTALALRLPPDAKKLPDNAVWTSRFEIRSQTSNRIYIVAQRKSDGLWGCSCPGWKAHRKCKHLREIGVLEYSIKRQVR